MPTRDWRKRLTKIGVRQGPSAIRATRNMLYKTTKISKSTPRAVSRIAYAPAAGVAAVAAYAGRRKKNNNPRTVRYDNQGDITYSSYKYTRKPRNKLEKALSGVKGKITRRYIETQHTSGGTGRQHADAFGYFETPHLRSMVTDVWQNTPGNDIGNPYTTANQTTTLGGTTVTNDLAPYIHNTYHKLTLTNLENAAAAVTIYDLVCKKDTDEDPISSWKRGMQEQGEAAPTTSDFPIGTTPLTSKAFRDKWAIVKKARIQLKPGETHKHNIAVRSNMVVSNNRLNSTDVAKSFLAGVARVCMVVAEGVLVSSTATGTVSTAPTNLGYMWQRQYTFSANMQAHRRMYPAATDLPTFIDGKVVQEDGDITPVVNA